MGQERWTWGLLALLIVTAGLLVGFFATLNALPGDADPGALYAGLTGALAGAVGAYFGIAAGGGAAQAIKEAKDDQAKALAALADVARLVPSPQNDEEKAIAVQHAIESLK